MKHIRIFDESWFRYPKPEPDITVSPLDKFAARNALKIINSAA